MTRTQIMFLGQGSILERFTVPYSDLTTAATTMTITLLALPKGSIIKGVRIKSQTAFAGGGASTCTVAVGSVAGAVNSFSAAYSIFSAVADTTFQMTTQWKAMTYAADTLTATFVSDVNVSTLTAGVVWIDVEYRLAEDLTGTVSGGFL